MMTQEAPIVKPAEEISCSNLSKSPATPAHLKQSNLKTTSEIFHSNITPKLETEELERWFEDLAQYERVLEDMARANLDTSFKEEMGGVENWFSALSEAERTAALYGLLHQCSHVQVRFFITVLQKCTHDPIREITSPAVSRFGLQTLNEWISNGHKNVSGLGSNDSNGDCPPTPTSILAEDQHPLSAQILKSQSFNTDGASPTWKSFLNKGIVGKRIPTLDLKNGANWNMRKNTTGFPRGYAKSATHIKDPNWGGKSIKTKNINNLTLAVEGKQDDEKALKSSKSPAFPPGLSPISWAATPVDGIFPGQQHYSPKANSTHSPYTPSHKNHNQKQGHNSSHSPNYQNNHSNGTRPMDQINFDLLENIPAWMRSMRLHKYTGVFESLHWKQIVVMDDQELTDIGVAALGARRKFLKTFESIIDQIESKGIELPGRKEENGASIEGEQKAEIEINVTTPKQSDAVAKAENEAENALTAEAKIEAANPVSISTEAD